MLLWYWSFTYTRTYTCSIAFRIWESGSVCAHRNVPKTSSFLWKVKQIRLSNDNHMHRVVQAHWKDRRRVDVKHCFLIQNSDSCESQESSFVYVCDLERQKKKFFLFPRHCHGYAAVVWQWQAQENREQFMLYEFFVFLCCDFRGTDKKNTLLKW